MLARALFLVLLCTDEKRLPAESVDMFDRFLRQLMASFDAESVAGLLLVNVLSVTF